MKTYFNIYHEGELLTSFFADTCEPAVGGIGLFTKGCTDWSKARVTISKEDLIVLKEANPHRTLFDAYAESYNKAAEWDQHQHFSEIMEMTRTEAKNKAYEIIYRGCISMIKLDLGVDSEEKLP